ncbi:MAG: Rhamnan synthesis, partial [Caulobacter sp.]|nr:Rhamnan synthesis [Caulobacter sp.]
SDFVVTPVGTLGEDPRGWRGAAIQGVKRVLGPLRGPIGGLYRRLREAWAEEGAQRRMLRASGGESGLWREAYSHALQVAKNMRSPLYGAPIAEAIQLKSDAPKLIAFYLPQFHPIPENDAWWGKGFTEWTNVSKAVPQFQGHYQPRLPADLGYYDLRQTATLADQIDLAKKAGVSAFCFHYYWFGGQRLLETPIELYLADRSLDLPFALCWANENWTRRWDGDEADVLMAQSHSPKDDVAVFKDLARHMADPRYLKVSGKPVLVVYRPEILPDAHATTERWRKQARAMGLGELHLLCTTAFGFMDYASHGFDGVIDFPPHAIQEGEITDQIVRLNPDYTGQVYDYPAVVTHKLGELAAADAGFVPGVMPSWDNQARKPWAGHAFHNAEPQSYHRWLVGALDHADRTARPGEAMVFVNAWNEWGEGAYLEPDRWFGHGYLQATRTAMSAYSPRLAADHPLIAEAAAAFAPKTEAVVLLHLYYPELIAWFADRLNGLSVPMDVMITIPDTWSEADLAALRRAAPQAWLATVENRGRDIRPFVHALRQARAFGYALFCKLHSKRSPHRATGDEWRASLVDGLASDEAAGLALRAFAHDPKLGMLAAAEARMRLGDPDVMYHNHANVDRLARHLDLNLGPDTPFAAGSMFWGRTEAFAALAALPDTDFAFEPELGRVDGTVAHAIERLTCAVVAKAAFQARFEL